MKIDLEPTWTEILNMVKSGHLDIKYTDLEKACQVADIVRKAQKDGKGFVKFVFEGGEVLVEYEEVDSESVVTLVCPLCLRGTDCSCVQYPTDSEDEWLDNDLIEETDYLEEDE